MDYDATDMARGYDRGRDHGPQFSELWMNVVESYVGKGRVDTILDLGCGTGRFSESLARHFSALVIGVDPSFKMVKEARRKNHDPRIRYILGRGESIPLSDDSAHLIFISMIFHHFREPRTAAAECQRVLRNGGIVFMRTGTRDSVSAYAYVEFFPESLPLLNERLPSAPLVRQTFEDAGFETVALDSITQEIAGDHAAYADKLDAGADSILASLSQREFDAGMTRLRDHATQVQPTPVREPIDVFVFR